MIFAHFALVGGDFMFMYRAANNYLQGNSIFEPGFFYPPLSVLIFLPFAYLTPSQAIVCWFIFTHVIILFSASLIYRCGNYKNKINALVAITTAFGFSMPLFGNILTGNANILVLLGISYVFYLLSTKKKLMIPLLLALMTYLKIFPAFLMMAFVRNRAWPLIKRFILYGLILGIISLVIFGVGEHYAFLKQLPNRSKPTSPAFNMSFTFILNLILGGQNNNTIIVLDIVFCAVLTALWWIIATKSDVKNNEDSTILTDLSIIIVIILLIFPAGSIQNNSLLVLSFYFILLFWLQNSNCFKHIGIFIILFLFISFWEIITYHLPILPNGFSLLSIFILSNPA